MKRFLQLLMLLAPVSALAWGCLDLPTKAQREVCWEKLQIEAQKPVSSVQKAIEEQNATEARARLAADKEALGQALQARAAQDRLDREERLAREMAFLREQQYQPARLATAPRFVATYGLPLVYQTPTYRHYPRINRSIGAVGRL